MLYTKEGLTDEAQLKLQFTPYETTKWMKIATVNRAEYLKGVRMEVRRRRHARRTVAKVRQAAAYI